MLEDIERIKVLKAQYFRYLDTKLWERFGDLFVPDADIDIDGVIERPPRFIELTRIWLGEACTVHAGHMPEIEITGPDSATGIWAMTDRIIFPANGTAPPQGMRGFGHYHEQYARVDDRWLIRSLKLTRIRVDVMAGGLPPLPTVTT